MSIKLHCISKYARDYLQRLNFDKNLEPCVKLLSNKLNTYYKRAAKENRCKIVTEENFHVTRRKLFYKNVETPR